jgi:SAM-dependent methyltransferase
MPKQWDKIFKEGGKVLVKPQEDMARVARVFKKEGIKKVLDLGCGSGRHLVYLAKQGFDVYGIDFSKQGIKIAKNWLRKEKLKAKLKIWDIYRKLPYEDNFFDAIISTQTLHHNKIEKIRKAVREIERVLKPRGLIFITMRRALRVKGWKKNKIVIHRWKGWKKKKVKYKVIGPRTYVPAEGISKGEIHFSFTKKFIKKEFKNFEIPKIWLKKGHYCFLGKLKEQSRFDLDD